jgi:hypothetical protein
VKAIKLFVRQHSLQNQKPLTGDGLGDGSFIGANFFAQENQFVTCGQDNRVGVKGSTVE